jgi:hypothetical protein
METRKYSFGGKNFIFRLSLRQSELLGPMMNDLIRECPELLSSQEETIVNIKQKFEAAATGEENKEIMKAVQDQVVNAFQNILKLKLRSWLLKGKHVSRMLAILLVPEGLAFDEENIDDRTKFFAETIDLEDEMQAAKVDEVIDYFFQKSGVFGRSTPTSSDRLTATTPIL